MEGLDIRRQISDRFGIASSLINLGYMYMDQGDYEQARLRLVEAVAIHREIGSKFYIAIALNNLGNVMRLQGDYDQARRLYAESLQLNRELGDGWAIAYLLEDIGCLEALTGEPVRALKLVGAASALRQKIGAPLPANDQVKLDKTLQVARDSLSEAEQNAAWSEGSEMSLEHALAFALAE
jgi:tetratricopeptide (TPR) repeat protein